ncbi:phosphoribosylamine/glycine ligase [Desulfofarcimen acetoxidans DSM 771]|uniref:Phosphoribosylamine--glycine ligase n=1 Tax=Desulfofarcimen acetoxidans (strain ATCC 49208 / DSM 771 / KCTC 5769 / VKM B-1644 / 5575) TaxID=485916 RepID=C8W1K4_DESAS|nr:phosphoribosylamine--glycine ligase [Desulfofarcimen acetoxidans]ACV61649.1 phosphoribosylamine/glycine ligase [Desulfofarcimen acetoxidans DSM 771]
MKVLVVGGGGREHALVWKLRQSPRIKEIFCAPGNAGIAGDAVCVDIKAEDIQGLLAFARKEKIDLTVVGPEAPLTEGIVDVFREAGLKIFGPSARAAAIEGSKVLAKEIMFKYGIPTAKYGSFTDPAAAYAYLKEVGVPCVVKADGLAAGKGVIVAFEMAEAEAAVRQILEDKAFGQAGENIIIEEFLQGEEVSVLAFTDGLTVVPMLPAQDHKQIFDGDVGPNTGGMGAYAPAPVCTPEICRQAVEEVLKPMVRAMSEEGRDYEGVLYAGLMVTAGGVKVLEFNARFGDPEAQPVLMLLETDLVEIIEAILERRLDQTEVKWKNNAAVCVVLASGGYPGSYEKGRKISGLTGLTAADAVVFHAGTALKDGHIVASGGRVLGVAAQAPDIAGAIARAYNMIEKISFEGMQYRRDIGRKALVKSGK